MLRTRPCRLLRPLGAIALAGGLALGVTVWIAGCERAGEERAASASGDRLLAGGDALLERVRTIELVTGDGVTTLERTGGPESWGVVEFDGYPADWEAVRAVTRGLAELRTVEARTARPDRHAMLGLLDPRDGAAGAPGEAGVLVRWLDERGAAIASVILGDFEGESGVRRAARLPDQDQAWLVEGITPVRTRAIDQVASQLTLIPRGRVGRVAIVRPGDGLRIDARREHWQRPLESVGVARRGRLRAQAGEAMESGLAYVPFLEVRSETNAPVQGEPEVVARYALFEGATVTLRLFPSERANERWATVRVEASETIGGDDFPNPEGVEAWIESRGKRWHGWAFRVPAEMLGVFLAEASELLEGAG